MYYDPDENEKSEITEASPQSEQTDRVNGEYHYKNGYTQRIYSDAHYVRQDEETVPPKYYTPPEKSVKEIKEPKPKKDRSFLKLVCACLVCALLGSIGGGAIIGNMMDKKLSAVEQKIEELSEKTAPVLTTASSGSVVSSDSREDSGVSASDIYELACSQVVGITTEVTYQNFFGMKSSSAVSGSGFIVSEDGYILTNYHVIEYAYEDNLEVSVMLHDGTAYSAAIVGVEADNDIAVLKIEADGFTPAVIGNSDELFVGDTVYAVGNPLGELDFSMTTGHVSAKDRVITTDESGEAITMFQIDAAVNSGNSGGPVYNDQGQVVGIVTAKYQSSGVEGIGFAIPVNDAAAIANDLITTGYVTGKASMGVTINTNYNAMYSQYYGWPMGAYVDSVAEGSAAEKAGIEPGDIITRLDGEEINGFDALKSAIKRHSAGDTVEVELYRADESRTAMLTFDESVPADTAPAQP